MRKRQWRWWHYHNHLIPLPREKKCFKCYFAIFFKKKKKIVYTKFLFFCKFYKNINFNEYCYKKTFVINWEVEYFCVFYRVEEIRIIIILSDWNETFTTDIELIKVFYLKISYRYSECWMSDTNLRLLLILKEFYEKSDQKWFLLLVFTFWKDRKLILKNVINLKCVYSKIK